MYSNYFVNYSLQCLQCSVQECTVHIVLHLQQNSCQFSKSTSIVYSWKLSLVLLCILGKLNKIHYCKYKVNTIDSFSDLNLVGEKMLA